METKSKNLNTSSSSRYNTKEHFPKSINSTWADYKPAAFFIEQAYLAGTSVEETIREYYN